MLSSRPSLKLFLSPNLHPTLLPRRTLHLPPVTQRVKLKLQLQRQKQSLFSNGNRSPAMTPTAAQTTSCHASRPKQLQAARSVSTLSSDFQGVIRGFVICTKFSVLVENQEVGGGRQLPDFRGGISSSCSCCTAGQALSCQETCNLHPGFRLRLRFSL